MRPDGTEPDDAASLRRQAEKVVRAQPALSNGSLSHDEALALVHELQVHQIELELQNEELSQTRREAEALRDRYADLYDFAPAGYFTLDGAGAIQEANLAGAVQLGVDRGNLIGARFAAFLAPDSHPGIAVFLARVLAGGTTEACEVSFAARPGRGPWHAQLRGRADAAGAIRLVVTDITDRRRAEEAVRESEAKYRNLVELSPDAILIHQDARIVLANLAAATLVGAGRPEDLVGRPVLDIVHPGARERAEANIDLDLRGEDSPITAINLLRDDRTTVRVQGRGALIPFNGRPAVQVVLRDVTEEKRAEEALRTYAENLRRSNEDLERFVYVSSHDLQEPLRSIVSFSQLLERRYKGRLGTDADEYIEFIVEGGNRMQALILDLLAYSRVNTTRQQIARTDTEDVLAEAERSLDVQLREAEATITHDPMPVVLADPTQLLQILTNLVSNAVKFRRPDEPLRVHVGARRTDGFWEFSVADNGIGINAEYFDRIFVIFQRLHTKDRYPGTGIGLAIVKRIVDRHGGTCRVESTPGEGSTFSFTLPAA